jgi:hypothetical protein
VSASQTEDVIRYIAGQAAHHAKRSYESSRFPEKIWC